MSTCFLTVRESAQISSPLYAPASFKASADLPEAIKLATGGIMERNGIKFPLPYGMKEVTVTDPDGFVLHFHWQA